MSVEVMQWLRGEIEMDLTEAKKITHDFVSRLNEEVIRLEAWVHELRTPAPAPTPGSVTSTVETDAAKLTLSGTQTPVEKVPLDPWEPVSLTTIGTLGTGSMAVSATISETGSFTSGGTFAPATGTLSTSPLSKEEPAQLTGTINTGTLLVSPLIDTATVALTGTLTSAPLFNDSASSFGTVSSDAVLIRGH